MHNYFENEVVIKNKAKTIKAILHDPTRIKLWDTEVAQVEQKEENVYKLIRRGPAINSVEYLTLELSSDQIIYHSFGGTIEYNIYFKLLEIGDETKIFEKVELTNVSEQVAKIDKLILIAKTAFNDNLQNLRRISDSHFTAPSNTNQIDFDSFASNREPLKKTNTHFFTNTIMINTNKESLLELLSNFDRIIEWDHDIHSIKKDQTGFRIVRTTPSINEFEHIEISQSEDTVTYNSTEGLVEYTILFTIVATDQNTSQLTQDVTLTGYPDIPIPFSVFQPVTKNAFYQVLNVLKTVAEIETYKNGKKD